MEGNLKTKLNQPVEFISEENYSLNFSEDNSIEDYKQNLCNKKIEFQPESIKNEVNEYIKQKLFVKFNMNIYQIFFHKLFLVSLFSF